MVYPALGIDMATRRKNQNLPNVESKRTHQYRYINKGLAMELLVGMVLTHLDTPEMVRNWCASPGGLPRSHGARLEKWMWKRATPRTMAVPRSD